MARSHGQRRHGLATAAPGLCGFDKELCEITEACCAHLVRHRAVEQPLSERRIRRDQHWRGAHFGSVPHPDCQGKGAAGIARHDRRIAQSFAPDRLAERHDAGLSPKALCAGAGGESVTSCASEMSRPLHRYEHAPRPSSSDGLWPFQCQTVFRYPDGERQARGAHSLIARHRAKS